MYRRVSFLIILASLVLTACGGAEAPASETQSAEMKRVQLDVPGFQPVVVDLPAVDELEKHEGYIIVVPGQRAVAGTLKAFQAYDVATQSAIVATIFAGISSLTSQTDAEAFAASVQAGTTQISSDAVLFVETTSLLVEYWLVSSTGTYTTTSAFPLYLENAYKPLDEVISSQKVPLMIMYDTWLYYCQPDKHGFNKISFSKKGDPLLSIIKNSALCPTDVPGLIAVLKTLRDNTRNPVIQKSLDLWIKRLGG